MSESSGTLRKLVDRAADRMLNASSLERVWLGAASTALALLIGLVIVALAGHSPIVFLNEMLLGVIGSERGIAITLRESTMYILTGVAVAVAFRAGVFNIGVQGQFVVGGMSAAMSILWTAPLLPANAIGGFLLVCLGIAVAIIAGGLYGAFPGALKAYYDANEIITTIMLNFIATGVVLYLLSGPWQGEGQGAPRSDPLPAHVDIPSIILDSGKFSIIGLVIALLTVALAFVLLARTRLGYDMVTSGKQEAAALYSGVAAERTIVTTMTISGMIAGLGGAIFAIMSLGGFVNPQGINTYGFDAIAVSLLAANNPLGVVPAGILFGGLERGGSFIGVATDIPAQLVDGVIGLVILFVAAPELFRMMAKRLGLGGDDR